MLELSDVRTVLVFIAMVACSGGAPTTIRTAPPAAPPVTSDSARGQVAPALPRRGDACTPAQPCTNDLRCAPLAGGYCASPCGVTGTACDGSCVETPRLGALCMARCTRDADCRVDEGYVCDPAWGACLLPNLPVIVPKVCSAPAPVARAAGFGPTTRLSTAALPGVYQHEPSSVFTQDGGIVALFTSRSGPTAPNVLGVARVAARGAAVIDVPFASSKPRHDTPRLARDRAGTLYAVWLGTDASTQELGLATSRDDGATWSPVRAVQAPTDCGPEHPCSGGPMVAIGPHPARRFEDVVYVLYGAAGLRVRASLDRGASFGPAVTPLAGTYGNAVVGTDGRLHVVTLNGSEHGGFGAAAHAVEYATSSDAGATFGKPVRVSVRDEMLPFYFANPSIAVDDRRGFVYVAYVRGGRDAQWDLVIATSRDRGTTWKRTRLGDRPACAIHLVPNLALDPVTGSLHVTWYDSRAIAPRAGRFAHAVCKPGAATCTERGAIDDVPFAALSTARHGATWIGDSQSLIVDARRRKLHAVWAQPVDENGTIVTRIFHAAAKL